MATAYTKAQVDSSGVATADLDPTKKPGRGMLHLRKIRLDFDAIATATGVALAANDTFQLFDVSAGEVVLWAGYKVLTATTGACVIDVGFTGGDVDVLIDGIVANDTTHTASTRGTLHPMYINANDTVDALTLTASGAGGVVEIFVLIARI